MRNLIFTIILFLFTTHSFAKENIMQDQQNKVKLSTSLGDIVIQLDPQKAPVSTKNFVRYAEEGFYDGTIFHRVIPNFMVQGGGFDIDFKQKKVHDPIKNEADNGLKNTRGTVAMARTADPDSATAQFFINHKDNSFLNYTSATANGWGYAVFATVIEGMDVVDKIAKVATKTTGGHESVPIENIVINKVEMF